MVDTASMVTRLLNIQLLSTSLSLQGKHFILSFHGRYRILFTLSIQLLSTSLFRRDKLLTMC